MARFLIASDADWIHTAVDAALVSSDNKIRHIRTGREVRPAVETELADLVILDLQIGSMGGMAACLDLRLESNADRLPRVPVLMLLDRADDSFLARRSDADGWLVKPIDALRLRRATDALLAGDGFHEGWPEPARAE